MDVFELPKPPPASHTIGLSAAALVPVRERRRPVGSATADGRYRRADPCQLLRWVESVENVDVGDVVIGHREVFAEIEGTLILQRNVRHVGS